MLPASLECFALRAELNGNYLQAVYVDKATGVRVEASAGTVVANARTRFVVERSKKEADGFIHVRCCYNNKYWVPVLVQDGCSSCWFISTANEPEDDLSSPSCTLFQALPVNEKDDSITFLHPGLRKFACVVSIGNETYMQLQENNSNNFTAVGLSGHKELPKHVAFKGDNGKYLGAKDLEEEFDMHGKKITPVVLSIPVVGGLVAGFKTARCMSRRRYFQFNTEDIGHASVSYTTFTNDDGTVRIASNNGKVWKRSSWGNWIKTGDMEDKDDRDTLFEVVSGDGFVALRNLGNNKFCRRLTVGGRTSYLSACGDSISQCAQLKLEEPFVSFEISDVKFHLDEARMYNKQILNVVTMTRTNNTSREFKTTFSFSKKVEMVSKWENTVSSKTGVQHKIRSSVSGVPIIAHGEVIYSTESGTLDRHTRSETNTDETTITEEYSVPPGTKLAGKLVATRASSDVPYSYKQTGVLKNGDVVTTIHNDGIYTVTNNYNFGIIVTDDEDEIRKLEG
ncbi:unnamed protein product [Alopecurus aequalis]